MDRTSAPESVAVARLRSACAQTRSLLSVGLEPCRDYLPPDRPDEPPAHEAFLMQVVEATQGLAAAYKFNLAHFEALGPPGWEMLRRVRRRLPAGAFVIADGKRGDIGSTAQRYADALFGALNADAATANPLMGHDSVEPFLRWKDRLTFVLALTSNPGAADFLLRDGLYRRIARSVAAWNEHGNCGLVVGATRGAEVAEVRAAAPGLPFLVPGIGAQGGEIEGIVERGGMKVVEREGGRWNGLLFHVTRGVLPGKGEEKDAVGSMRRRALEWRDRIKAACASSAGEGEGGSGS